MDKFSRQDVEVLDAEDVYQGFFQIRSVKLRHRLYQGGWSKTLTRELFKRRDAVGVLLFDPQLDVVALIEQFRIGVLGNEMGRQRAMSPWVLELVAGLIDDADEPPEQVAKRESQEEAGVLIERLEPICEYFSSPGGSNEYFYLFAGKADLSAAGGVYGLEKEGEDIRVHVLPVEQLWLKLQQGELNNAHTLIAAQWLQLHHQTLKANWLA